MNRLLETTAQLLDAQKLASLGSYVFEVPTGQWKCSAILDELFGLPATGFIKDLTGWLDLVHPEDREDLRAYLTEQVLKNHAPFDRQYRIVRWNDRRERWVHGLGKLVLDDQGRVVKMVGVIQDITERKRAEEQLSVQVSALTAADNVIVIVNRHGAIEWVNPAFTKVSGYSAAEAVGANPRILKSGQHPPSYYANLWATVLTGNVWRGEIINRHKDGRLYTEEMTITPVRGAAGQISHFIAIKQDITERRHLENRMQQAQKMEAIGNLAGGIAHDFNNILGAMFGYAHLLQQDTQGDPVAQESVEEILKAANRAKELVQQILTFSRKREQKPEIIKLDLVIREAIKFLRASLPAQIKIELNLAADTPTVLADPTQIYQVTMNLATNALHAMEDRPGRLSVHLDPVQPGAQLLQAHPELKPIPYARLTVADTGHGMDTTTLQRIFEPFFTTKQVGRGTGLGLAVVHGIIQSHHGVITVESQVGQGTTFTLYFPAQERTETSPAVVAGAAPLGQHQKILVLDDEPALTSVMQRALRRLDYQVTTSNDAAAAVRLVRDQPSAFDLVITDLTMPELNGLEVARQLRALRPDLPIILVSGYSVAVDADSLRAAGICERLEKPVTPGAIAEAAARALKKP
jgi:PAS domain S-box-containing protein